MRYRRSPSSSAARRAVGRFARPGSVFSRERATAAAVNKSVDSARGARPARAVQLAGRTRRAARGRSPPPTRPVSSHEISRRRSCRRVIHHASQAASHVRQGGRSGSCSTNCWPTIEKEAIVRALAQAGGNKTRSGRAARHDAAAAVPATGAARTGRAKPTSEAELEIARVHRTRPDRERAMKPAAWIVCERTGRWAAGVAHRLPHGTRIPSGRTARIREVRTLARTCRQRLDEQPNRLALVEVRPENLASVLAWLAKAAAAGIRMLVLSRCSIA